MLKNRLNLMIYTLTLKFQLQILNMLAAVKKQVAFIGPTNDHHQTTTLVYVPVDLQLGNATLQCTILVNVQLMYFLHHKGTI